MPLIEFIGLPGAGKSALQGLLAEELGRRGVGFTGRKELVRILADSKVGGALADGARRRAATALYLAGLGARALQWRLQAGLFQGLLDRSRRLPLRWLVEDRGLAEHFRDYHPSDTNSDPGNAQVRSLDEGFAHHLAACAVWLGPQAWRLAGKAPYTAGSGHLLIHVAVPPGLALQRLRERGRPRSWPQGPDDAAVLLAFDQAIGRALDLFAPAMDVMAVDWSADLNRAKETVTAVADAVLSLTAAS